MKDSADFRITPGPPCPCCGVHLDGATSVGHPRRPSCGDVTICAYCFAWCTFTEALDLRLLGLAERDQLSTELRLLLADIERHLRKRPSRA